ncbi:ABC transporter ATP-binding protein [Coleofasciculus sp. FACHB-64]|uniref:ABC transporter ATP-binding protein n=1 Tax=Cyanophyceae TaxID=3028117 RepID=UPI0016828C93|nr:MULTISPECIES: ABC transporter ATP-binding protein [unclassified Coleofasciculus]MBD1841464.1 ABC transporter ATP-binding protein [Coleofasciculus sp. FACHB-501]MBD2048890.1 ABC transporter ATP-binding protein [Coleofasciculus sp. FACHB-64]
MSDTVLDIRNLQVQFLTDEKQILAVDGISFKLSRGQTLGIVGESGSGKSVTSLAVMGLVPTPGRISGGEIWFQNSQERGGSVVNLRDLSAEELRKYRGGQISMIFQEPMSSLNPVFTCGFQLVEAIRQHQNVTPAEARRQAIARLQEVKLLASDEEMRQRYLEERPEARRDSEAETNQQVNQQKLAMLDRYPHELSGGQLQRMMIAMAISCNPAVLIADEPTTALDVTVQATILDLLRELRDARGMSMMFIGHDLGVIAEIADVVAVMYQGKIVEYGSVEQIFSNPQHPYTKGLLACRPSLNRRLKYLPTVADFMEVVKTPSGEIEIREKTGVKSQESEEILGSTQNPEAIDRIFTTEKALLSVRDLQVGFPIQGMFGQTKRYLMAVNGISFDVYPGETLGLVGESGCGKSTLARTILRLIEPTSGQIEFEGEDITKVSNRRLRQLRREMQIVFQNPFSSLDPRLKIGDAVMEPLQIHHYGKNSKERRDRAAYLLERVGLNPGWMNRYPHEFSGGQRQRVCIARALALNPKFIICDESVSALDVSVQAQVLNLLKEVQSEFGLTYIFISHDLSVVKFMSDRIMVMNRGKIEEIGSAENLYREPKQEYTRQLIAAIPTGSLEQIQQRQQDRIKISAGGREIIS